MRCLDCLDYIDAFMLPRACADCLAGACLVGLLPRGATVPLCTVHPMQLHRMVLSAWQPLWSALAHDALRAVRRLGRGGVFGWLQLILDVDWLSVVSAALDAVLSCWSLVLPGLQV